MFEYDLHAMNRAELAALIERECASVEDWLRTQGKAEATPLLRAADEVRTLNYDRRVFFRGLIEYSNYCARGCLYCGLRAPNGHVHRYRLDMDTIMDCVRHGYALGFRSFVLQGGEDAHFNDGHMADVVARIKSEYPDAALTLSMGELKREVYARLREAGADRYLLRHETADAEHYSQLHPQGSQLASRLRCLWELAELGFAVGAGFMVGSPGQTHQTLASDLILLRELMPAMVGIGPFLPQSDTPFVGKEPGSLALTLTMLALVRLLLPKATLPATTALGTLVPGGREMGLRAGANVVMPNLTPTRYRGDYLLYDGKIGVDSGVDDGLELIKGAVTRAGFEPDFSRGDPLGLSGQRKVRPL